MNSVLPEAHGTFYEIHRMRVEVPNWLGKKMRILLRTIPPRFYVFGPGGKIYIKLVCPSLGLFSIFSKLHFLFS